MAPSPFVRNDPGDGCRNASLELAFLVDGSGSVGAHHFNKLLDLVVQCAVQAQLAYHNEFKSEVRAKWLESFLGHEYLHVERIGGRECRIVYRGLSGLNDCS